MSGNLNVVQWIGIAFAIAAVLFWIGALASDKGTVGVGFKDSYRMWYGFAIFFTIFAIVAGTSK